MWNSGIIALLVAVEYLEVCLNTVTKSAMRGGMSSYIFALYSNVLALLFLVPSTFIFHRLTSPPPKMTFSMVWRMLVLGLVSSSMQVFIFIGINYGSPTLASAMTNLTPAYTFILALLFRMERLDLKVKSSQAKFMGTIVSIVGAFIVTLYKGSAIIFTSTPSNLIHEFLTSPQSSWIIGGFFLPVANFFKSLMYIVQTWIIKDYPAELMLTLCSVIFMSLMPAIVCVIAERDQSAWELRPGTELVAIGYSAIYGVSLRNAIHILALRLKGPMFVTMFKPLGIVIAVIMGIIFLGDTLHLGRQFLVQLGMFFICWLCARMRLSILLTYSSHSELSLQLLWGSARFSW